MTGLEAVTAVAVYIGANKVTVFGERGGKVFKYEKKKDYAGDYIAVNNLPFIHRNITQTDTVNVNVHVKDLDTGEPNTKRLAEIVNEVVDMFNFTDGVKLGQAYYRYFSDSRPTPDRDGTSYVNIQIDCIHTDEKTLTEN